MMGEQELVLGYILPALGLGKQTCIRSASAAAFACSLP